MTEFANSRSMPANILHALEDIAAGAERKFILDKPIADHLIEVGFAVVADGKKLVTLAITEAGKNAMERAKRGVDPYIRMTA